MLRRQLVELGQSLSLSLNGLPCFRKCGPDCSKELAGIAKHGLRVGETTIRLRYGVDSSQYRFSGSC